MSKRIVMSILMSIVSTIVMTVGSFTCKKGGGQDSGDSTVLAVQHPDECMLMEPQSLPMSVGEGTTLVKVSPGKVHFVFDCNGKSVEVDHDVKDSEHIWKFQPDAP